MGVGYGVTTALDVFGSEPPPDDFVQKHQGKPDSPTSEAAPSGPIETEKQKPGEPAPAAPADPMIQRFDHMEERLTRLENSVEASMAQIGMAQIGHAPSHVSDNHVSQPGANYSSSTATRSTTSPVPSSMRRWSISLNTLDTDIQRRFDIQNRSVQSLRTMVARTDELLEQVLEAIESTGIPA